ncbi:MAG: hypothetical protein M3299_06490 [Thermoproteota archaeon]|nr:hypothetical protein [Thermoproteota archaeon]
MITFEEEQYGCRTKAYQQIFLPDSRDRDIMLNLRIGGGGAAESMDHLSGLLKYLKCIHKG